MSKAARGESNYTDYNGGRKHIQSGSKRNCKILLDSEGNKKRSLLNGKDQDAIS
jgi:hypothetical protein